MQISTDGIVLKQRKIAGNRRIIVLFTRRYGLINAGTSINERGKSKAALALRPFTYAEYNIFSRRDSYNIDSASVKRSFYSIGEDIDKYFTASKLLTYLTQILEEGRSKPKIFDMTLEFLESISVAKADSRTMLYAFIAKTLPLLGIMPEIKSCVNCGRPYDRHDKKANTGLESFSVSAGGLMCNDCVKGLPETDISLLFRPSFDIVEVLRFLIESPLSIFAGVEIKPSIEDELRAILSSYLRYYLEIDILEDDALKKF